jgi:hypothetical protein
MWDHKRNVETSKKRDKVELLYGSETWVKKNKMLVKFWQRKLKFLEVSRDAQDGIHEMEA